jgi:hypothetical protein
VSDVKVRNMIRVFVGERSALSLIYKKDNLYALGLSESKHKLSHGCRIFVVVSNGKACRDCDTAGYVQIVGSIVKQCKK